MSAHTLMPAIAEFLPDTWRVECLPPPDLSIELVEQLLGLEDDSTPEVCTNATNCTAAANATRRRQLNETIEPRAAFAPPAPPAVQRSVVQQARVFTYGNWSVIHEASSQSAIVKRTMFGSQIFHDYPTLYPTLCKKVRWYFERPLEAPESAMLQAVLSDMYVGGVVLIIDGCNDWGETGTNASRDWRLLDFSGAESGRYYDEDMHWKDGFNNTCAFYRWAPYYCNEAEALANSLGETAWDACCVCKGGYFPSPPPPLPPPSAPPSPPSPPAPAPPPCTFPLPVDLQLLDADDGAFPIYNSTPPFTFDAAATRPGLDLAMRLTVAGDEGKVYEAPTPAALATAAVAKVEAFVRRHGVRVAPALRVAYQLFDAAGARVTPPAAVRLTVAVPLIPGGAAAGSTTVSCGAADAESGVGTCELDVPPSFFSSASSRTASLSLTADGIATTPDATFGTATLVRVPDNGWSAALVANGQMGAVPTRAPGVRRRGV